MRAPPSFTRSACGERSAETFLITDRERASTATPPGLLIFAPATELHTIRLPLGSNFWVAGQRKHKIEWSQVWDRRSDAGKLPFKEIANQLHRANNPTLILENNFPIASQGGRGVIGYVYEVQEQASLVRNLASVGVRGVLRQRTELRKGPSNVATTEMTIQDLEEIQQHEEPVCDHEECPGHVS